LRLKKDFKLSEILIDGRRELPRGYFGLQTQGGELSIHRKSLVSKNIGFGMRDLK
jgi:hypothetical protein